LQPIIKRVYAPKGQQPVVSVNPRYEWLYVYAFVHPNSGRSVWYLLPSLNAAAFQVVLEDFARDIRSSSDKRVLIVLDNAPWHKAKALRVPEGLEFVFLPAYSPELQPAERLWALCDETGVLAKLCGQLSKTHLRSNSKPARPYRWRLINFNFVTCPWS